MEEANSEVVGPHTSHMMDSSAQIRYVPWTYTNDVRKIILSSKNFIFIKRKNGYIRKISLPTDHALLQKKLRNQQLFVASGYGRDY
jgi:hypothetical protein